VYASPETAFAWQANSFRPDKIQRRVLQSALTWTARWTIPVIIISPMTCGSFGLRIRYADVINVSTNSQVDPSDVHRPMSPTNLFSVSSTISLTFCTFSFSSQYNNAFAVCLPRCRERQHQATRRGVRACSSAACSAPMQCRARAHRTHERATACGRRSNHPRSNACRCRCQHPIMKSRSAPSRQQATSVTVITNHFHTRHQAGVACVCVILPRRSRLGCRCTALPSNADEFINFKFNYIEIIYSFIPNYKSFQIIYFII
jgi:hypothetical protein